MKRPRREFWRSAQADDFKSRSKGSPPGLKSIEETCTPGGEMKYTFITCTAEAFEPSGRSSAIPKKPGRKSEQRTMTRQRSGSVAQEYRLSMDNLVEVSLLDVGDEKPHMFATPSVKSEDTRYPALP